ncbi:hypothetical protein JCM10908_005945 [Rhodotorula pacifica]|uniref:uncharacterized protein n=1 Tax=Rhodotorula pacifica TaxID=1495444 RepID=UPI003173418D
MAFQPQCFLPEAVFSGLVRFLHGKRDALAAALANGHALKFDALLFGILPVNPELVLRDLGIALTGDMQGRVRRWLEIMRSFEHETSGTSTGWKKHIETMLHKLTRVTAALRNIEGGQQAWEAWATDFAARLAKNEYDAFGVLLQFGVKELLYQFWKEVVRLVVKQEWAGLIRVLVRSLEAKHHDRTDIGVIELSKRCAIVDEEPGKTLEALSSDPANPSYLYVLPLPVGDDLPEGHRGQHHQRQQQSHHPDVHAGPHELGSQPRIGNRAARRYAIDRREFANRVRQPWRV